MNIYKDKYLKYKKKYLNLKEYNVYSEYIGGSDAKNINTIKLFAGDHNGQFSQTKIINDLSVFNTKNYTLPDREDTIDAFISNYTLSNVSTLVPNGTKILTEKNISDHYPIEATINFNNTDYKILNMNCMFNNIASTPVGISSYLNVNLKDNEEIKKLKKNGTLKNFTDSLKKKWAITYHRAPKDSSFYIDNKKVNNIDKLYSIKPSTGIKGIRLDTNQQKWIIPIINKNDDIKYIHIDTGYKQITDIGKEYELSSNLINKITEWIDEFKNKILPTKGQYIYDMVIKYKISFLTEFDNVEYEIKTNSETYNDTITNILGKTHQVIFFPKTPGKNNTKGKLIVIKHNNGNKGVINVLNEEKQNNCYLINKRFDYESFPQDLNWKDPDKRAIGICKCIIDNKHFDLRVFHFQTPSKFKKKGQYSKEDVRDYNYKIQELAITK